MEVLDAKIFEAPNSNVNTSDQNESPVNVRCSYCVNCKYPFTCDDASIDFFQRNCLLKLCDKKIPKVILMQINTHGEKPDLTINNNNQNKQKMYFQRYRRIKCQDCEECRRPVCGQCFACRNKASKQKCVQKRCKWLQLPKRAVCYICTAPKQVNKDSSDEDHVLLECAICNRVSHKSCHETSGDSKSHILPELINYWQCPDCEGKSVSRKKLSKMKQFSKSGLTDDISYQSPSLSLNDCKNKDPILVQTEKKIKQPPKVASTNDIVCKPMVSTTTGSNEVLAKNTNRVQTEIKIKQLPKVSSTNDIVCKSMVTTDSSSNEIPIKNTNRRQPCDEYKGKFTRKYKISFKDYQNKSFPHLSVIPNGLILELFNYWQKANKEKRQEWDYLLNGIRSLSASQLKGFSDKELGEKVYQCLYDTKKFIKENKLSANIINHESKSVLDAPFCNEPIKATKNSMGLTKLKVDKTPEITPEADKVGHTNSIKNEEIKVVVNEFENFEIKSCDLTYDEEIEVRDESCSSTEQIIDTSMANVFLFRNKQVTLVNDKILGKSIISSPVNKVIGKQDLIIFHNKNNTKKISCDADKSFQSSTKTNNMVGLCPTKEANKCLHLDGYNNDNVKFQNHGGNQCNERTFTLEECIQAIEEEENFVCPNITYIDPPMKVSLSKIVINEENNKAYKNVEGVCQIKESNLIIAEDHVNKPDHASDYSSLIVKQPPNLGNVDEDGLQHLKHNAKQLALQQKIIEGECSIMTNKEGSLECCNANFTVDRDKCIKVEDHCSIVKSGIQPDMPVLEIDNLIHGGNQKINDGECSVIISKKNSQGCCSVNDTYSFENSNNSKEEGVECLNIKDKSSIVKAANVFHKPFVKIDDGVGTEMINPLNNCESESIMPKESHVESYVASENEKLVINNDTTLMGSMNQALNSQLIVNENHEQMIKNTAMSDLIKDKDKPEMFLTVNGHQALNLKNFDVASAVTAKKEAIIIKEKNTIGHIQLITDGKKKNPIVYSSNCINNQFHIEKKCEVQTHILKEKNCQKDLHNVGLCHGSSMKNISIIGENDNFIQVPFLKEDNGNDPINKNSSQESLQNKYDYNGTKSKNITVGSIDGVVEVNTESVVIDNAKLIRDNDCFPLLNSNNEDIQSPYEKNTTNVGSFKSVDKNKCQIVSSQTDDSCPIFVSHNIKNKSNSNSTLEIVQSSENMASNTTIYPSLESLQITPNENQYGSFSVESANEFPEIVDKSRNCFIGQVETTNKNDIDTEKIITNETTNVNCIRNKDVSLTPILSDVAANLSTTNYVEVTTCTANKSEEYSEMDSNRQIFSAPDIKVKSCLLPHSLDDPMQVLLEACTQIDRGLKEKNNDLICMESSDTLKATCISTNADNVHEKRLSNTNILTPAPNPSLCFANSDSNLCNKYNKNYFLKHIRRYKTKYMKMKSKLYTMNKMKNNVVETLNDYRSELLDAYEEDMAKSILVNQLEDQLKCSKCELSLMKNNIQKLNLEKIDIMKSLIEKSKKIIFLEDKVNEMMKVVEELKGKKPELVTMIGGQFTPEVNDVFKELLACNVPIEKIPNLIRITVENLTGMVVTELPFDSVLTEWEKDKSSHLDTSKLFQDYIKKDKDKETLLKFKDLKKIDSVTKEINSSNGTERNKPIPLSTKDAKGYFPNYKLKTQTKEKCNKMRNLTDQKSKKNPNNKFIEKLSDHKSNENTSKIYPSSAIKTEHRNNPNQEKEKPSLVLKTNDKLKSNFNNKQNKQMEHNYEGNKEDHQYSSSKKDQCPNLSIASKTESEKQKRPQRTTANCYEYRQLNQGIYDRRDKGSSSETNLTKKIDSKSSMKEVVSHKNEEKEKIHTKDHRKRKYSRIEYDDLSSSDSEAKSKRKKIKSKKKDKPKNLLSNICKDDDNITVEEDGTIVIGSLAKLFGL